MDTRDDLMEHDHDDRDDDKAIDPRDPSVTGDVLGISQVPAGAQGEIHRQKSRREREIEDDEQERVTALENEEDLGARDVTRDGRGQTGPETGGHGSTPQRTGATGTDIGG